MRTLKSAFGVMSAVVPILYCGSLLYYFLDLSGSVEEVKTNGLGPTVLGLGIVGLLFCIPLIFKIVRLFAGPRSPGSGGRPDAPAPDDKDGFDADAAIARYMARKSTEGAPNAPIVSPARSGPARPSGFGRKIR